MKVGYARSSTGDQTAGLEAQERDLAEAGCERVLSEFVSSVDKTKRLKLAEAISFVREGDTLVVTRLDRLARSVGDLCGIVDELEAKGVSLKVLAMDLDTSTATGKLMLNMLGSISEFERSLMLERQREGIAKAKAEGRYKGRKPTARVKADRIKEMDREGYTRKQISKALSVSERSVYRHLGTKEGETQQ